MFKLIRFIVLLYILSANISIYAESQNPVEISTVVEQYNGKNYYLHTVEAKQTIYAIAKAYQITPESVLISNPAARHGIRINQVLRIPVGLNPPENIKNLSENDNQPAILKEYDFIYHVAGDNDRFSYIAEIYLVSENNIRLANPSLTEPLNQGVYVRVPISSKDKKPLVAEDQFKRNDYDPFISPAKSKDQKGSSRADLANSSKPEEIQLVSPFEIQKPKVESKPKADLKPKVEEAAPKIDKNIKQHVVKPKETLYSLSKMYNLSTESIRQANPGIGDAIKIGQVLIIPNIAEISPSSNIQITENSSKTPVTESKNQIEKSEIISDPINESDSIIQYTVKKGETLYSIARNNAVSIEELKKKNKGLTEQLRVGQVILIPKKKISSSFIIHEVTEEEKITQLASNYEITVERLQKSNPGIGRKVYAGQKVKIPIGDNLRISPVEPIINHQENVSNQNRNQFEPEQKPVEIEREVVDPNRLFKVALMLPLYLEQVDSMTFTPNTNPDLFASAKPLSFIQFYEGFMIAADSLVKTMGLNLEVQVFDVDQNLNKLTGILNNPKLKECDLIIGPFFGNAFEKVAKYALENKISIVNPMTPRAEIIVNNPYVIKVKPGDQFQYDQVASVIKVLFPQSKVFIFRSHSYKYNEESQRLLSILTDELPKEVSVSNAKILEVVADRSSSYQRETEQYVSSITIEGKRLYTNQLQQNITDSTYFSNQITEFIFQTDSIKVFSKKASAIRPNIVIAFADDNVFAMQLINKINQVADTFDVRLIGLPNWEKYDNLFVENLLRMSATYLLPSNINYNDAAIIKFMQQFQQRFNLKPEQYAFEGFDVGYYFLEALMRFGENLSTDIVGFEKDLLQTQYHFTRSNENDGLENQYWNFVKHYDYQLLPVNNVYFFDKNWQ
jgi:LysM repeat protein